MCTPFITRLAPGIVVIYIDLPSRGREMVTRNEDGSYTILVNSRLSADAQREAVSHALRHIESGDFDRVDVQTIEEAAHEDI